MVTKIVVITAVAIAAVVFMYILGKMADGKTKDEND